MDTVEELNGTYFYRGLSNLSASELLFWIFLDETSEQLGVKDYVSLGGMLLGIPDIPTRGKPIGATPGTSPEVSPQNETGIEICDLIDCATNSMRSLYACPFIMPEVFP